MNIMYVAARYHTNQIPVMKGWIENGHKVCFISQYKAGIEDYRVLEPNVLGYGLLSKCLISVYKKSKSRKGNVSTTPYTLQAQFGFPPIFKMAHIMRDFKPDLVIMRDRSMYNVGAYILCSFFGFKSVLYNQTPMWENKEENLNIVHKLFRKFSPKRRITPVMGTKDNDKVIKENSVYVPFVIEPMISPDEKKHFKDGLIQVLCIGKFEPRKNHLMLLEILKELVEEGKHDLRLTLVGENSTKAHENYVSQVRDFIALNNLTEYVTVKFNLKISDVYEEYAQTDLFVLPSTGEFASVSQLEAMSCSLPAICSDTNGTSCYIEPNKNGYLFKDKDKEDLKRVIKEAIQSREHLITLGDESYRLVMNKYLFTQYLDSIQDLITGVIK